MVTISYPPELPVSARREDIAAAIRDNQVVIVAGETGSGKTTQLPKIALELGRSSVGHTQPRRIAARAVAERVAFELGTELGDVVGYQVRFTDQSSKNTQIKVMTDGILLAQIQRDPRLMAYDTIIIDEAHERSLNIDFLLGYLTNLLPQRPDLKVIITSATIDSERFSEHFKAPIIEVTGRTYPVEIRYREPQDGDVMAGIVRACDELMAEGDGDILVFLSGEREIRDAADALAGSIPRDRVELLPLYSRLSAAEQHRVFQSHARRRIVLATNVAETSLTVPGIHYVVDPGTARISRYSKATKVQRLPIEPISQASARQRAGRAGRLAPGVAIRLYSQEDFEGRPEFTEPEILRTSLASVVLRMIAVGVAASPDDVARFPFVEPPDTRAIRDGVNLLAELGAVKNGGGKTRLTKIGHALAQLPMDPRQARMVVEAAKHGVTREVAIIAAALSIQDPRERPQDKREEADLLHKRFADPTSDLLSYLNLWQYIREQQKELSGNAFRRMCRSEYLNYLRIREWQDVVEQIRRAAKSLKIAMPSLPDGNWDEDAIHRSVLAGLLSQIGAQDAGEIRASSFAHLRGEAKAIAMRRARKQATNEYLGARGARFAINPGSPLSKKPPAFVMAAELVETNRLWARDVAAIKAEWAEQLAGDIAKRTYSEPHWSKRRGAAVATEKVLVYGVPIVADRTVLWGRIDPADARDLFIRHALVEGEWETHHRFWKHNQRLLTEAEEIAARTRTPAALADDEALFAFYDDRIPNDVISARHFDNWWKKARRDNPDLLTLTLEDALPGGVDHGDDFPDTAVLGDITLRLSYQFEPGSAADGVTVHVPLAVLPRLAPEGLDWLVPGLQLELVTATIRALPKPVRVKLVPAPDAARAIDSLLTFGEGSFREAFTAAALEARGVEIPAEAWEGLDERLPAHLRVTYRVEDGDRVVGEGPSLGYLQRELAPKAQEAVAKAVAAVTGAAPASARHMRPGPRAPRTGGTPDAGSAVRTQGERLGGWPASLPEVVEGDGGVRGYPTIVDSDGAAWLQVLAAPDADAHARGVRRLLLTEVGLPVKRITTRWTGAQALALGASPYRSTDALVDDLQLAAVMSLVPNAADIRTQAAYEAARTRLRDDLEDGVQRIALLTATILTEARALDGEIRSATSMALLATVSEVRAQANDLAGDGFLSRTPPDRLQHLPRYLAALRRRLEAASGNVHRDAALAWQVREVEDEWVAAGSPASVKWMIEELRVSLFAQALGTDGSVSPQRIRKALAALAAPTQG